jgi:membrane-associated phospholipid phosphatase
MTLYEIYEFTRGLIPHNGPLAVQHAHAIWDWEVQHGLFVEPAWQEFWLRNGHVLGWLRITPDDVSEFLNTGYLYVHFAGTVAFLFWVFFFRRNLFAFVRNMFFVVTGISLFMYMAYPLAPPRLATNLLYDNRHYTFIDTIQKVLGPVSKAQTSEIGYNPYAAMPSLHFAWALIIGCTLFFGIRNWALRILGLCYPFWMLAIVVISGNHFFADAIGSTIVVAVSFFIVLGWTTFRARKAARQAEEEPPALQASTG